MRRILAFWVVFGVLAMAYAEDFVFETDLARYAIGSDGLNKSLVEKGTGKEWILAKPTPFATVKKAGKVCPASGLVREGDLFRARFGEAGIQAEYRITARPHYIVVELVRVQGEGVEDIRIAQIRVNITENAGGGLNVRWNEEFAVCLMGLSDRVSAASLGADGVGASVYPEFGMEGQKAALIAVPTPQFLSVVQEVERDFGLPSPKIGGQWAKTSRDVRMSYLFTDLTEANADETIRFAKLGGFGYIMTYSSTWSSSLGSYPINTKNFPKGEESLRAVIDKCHAAGLKVGMHMLTSFVSKRDPLVSPKPDPRLLKDDEATLAADFDEKAKEIIAAEALTGFPTERAYYGGAKAGLDVQIDDEVIQYRAIGGANSERFLRCVRGFAGTKAVAHKAGAKIHHLCERYGCYLVDLKTSLKDELSERVAGVFNRCGFDMIYYDGGECNAANGPAWYWVSPQQMGIYERVKRDILVQGSGTTHWTWHIFARGNCDDYAAVAPKQYLDYHKIGDSWVHHHKSFMPAELGWWGFLDYAPHHPATTPDEVEYYAVRMLALDTPVSLETHLAALKQNGRTEEMLKLLGEYEELRLSNAIPASLREKLRTGEWHMVREGEKRSFCPIRYDVQRAVAPGEVRVKNEFGSQPLRFRFQAVPTLAPVGDKANIVLLRSDPLLEIRAPESKAAMPGALGGRIEFAKPAGEQASVFMVGPTTQLAGGQEGKPLDLLQHRALAVKLRVEGAVAGASEPCAVLNVQLEAGGKTYRDHYVDLNFTGEKTVIIPEPTTERLLPEFRPAHANYAFKAAMYGFNYKGIVALNFRWMRSPKAKPLDCRVGLVEALAESETLLKAPELSIGGDKMTIPAELKTGDYAEFWADGPVRCFDRNGVLLCTVKPTGAAPTVQPGENRLVVGGTLPPVPVELTTITLGGVIGP